MIDTAQCTECLFSEPVFDIDDAIEKYPTVHGEDAIGPYTQLRCPECNSPLEIKSYQDQINELTESVDNKYE